jgi:hypothetical protein
VITNPAVVVVNQLDETNTINITTTTQTINPSLITIINNYNNPIQIVNNSGANINITGLGAAVYQLIQQDGQARIRRMAINLAITGTGCALTGIIISMHHTGAGRGS